jgi:uncharacterized protein (TIGR02231 family)
LILAALVAVNVQSAIDSVVVYPDQAMVVRKAAVTLTGSAQLVFAELPGVLDDNSIRVRAQGLKIGEVQVKPSYIAEPVPRVRQLEDSLRGLDRRDRVFNSEKAMLAAKLEFLGSVKVGGPELLSKELNAGKADAASWNTAIGFLGTQYMAVTQRQLEIDEQQTELQRTRNAVAQELASVRARVENRKTVTVDVVAERGERHELTLAYRVPYSVSWEPYYELRAAPTTENVTLAYYVRMEQSTNEDWENVHLLISTARPSAGGVAPEPYPWFVDAAEAARFQLQSKTRGWNNADGMMAEQNLINDRLAPAPPPSAQALDAGISLQYALPGRLTLRSGEDPKKFFIHEEQMPAGFSYYVYPRQRAAAYLRARLQNSSDFVFLGGDANTYVGDEFTGKTTLANVAPGESASPSFGIDDRMKVHHQRTRLYTTRSGLLSKRTRTEFEFKTTVENYHAKPVTLTLVEQIPTSASNDVRVALTKLDLKGAVENKDNGTYTFTIELQPQEKVVVNIGYAVEYPSNIKIAGLYDAINPARAQELNQQYEMKKK